MIPHSFSKLWRTIFPEVWRCPWRSKGVLRKEYKKRIPRVKSKGWVVAESNSQARALCIFTPKNFQSFYPVHLSHVVDPTFSALQRISPLCFTTRHCLPYLPLESSPTSTTNHAELIEIDGRSLGWTTLTPSGQWKMPGRTVSQIDHKSKLRSWVARNLFKMQHSEARVKKQSLSKDKSAPSWEVRSYRNTQIYLFILRKGLAPLMKFASRRSIRRRGVPMKECLVKNNGGCSHTIPFPLGVPLSSFPSQVRLWSLTTPTVSRSRSRSRIPYWSSSS